ncbi:MAG TPA: AMIN domain-containing protein [Candidatus Sulfotelmatobacter sp.]|nr:AMIN domain-containing protein [Candidatus Sulfotelmatobacter sp.]
MYRPPRILAGWLLLAGLVPLATGGTSVQAQTSVRRVKVLGSKDAVEIEVEGSDRLVPQTRVLTGPDRLVIDFPNAVPGNELRSQSVNQGEVKDVRVGLFQSKPPVTRLVLDLKTAQSYQVFPYGRTVMIKVVAAAPDTSAGVDDFPPEPKGHAGLVAANYTTGAERIQVQAPVQPPLDVSFRDGLLAIKANKATLSEVLFAVQQRTGAEVATAPGAEQERVVVDLGPAPAPEVMAQLLNGSRFNFLILSAASDPRKLDRVILSQRTDGAGNPMPLPQMQAEVSEDDAANQAAQADPNNRPPNEIVPRPQPEVKADDNTPDQ